MRGKNSSSSDSGEGGPDFEEEVVVIAETVGHALDDLDLVVEAFEQAGVERPTAVGEDAAEVFPELLGEGDERGDIALDGRARASCTKPYGLGCDRAGATAP